MQTASTDTWLGLAHEHAAPLYGAPDIIVSRGQGMWLSTLDGQELLDCAGGMGVSLLGHGHPHVRRAIVDQIDQLLHTSNALLSPAPIALATQLARLSGGMQSFFVNSGAEATEGALKLSRAYFHRQGAARPVFVACHGGFHGRTLGALSVTGQAKLQEGFAPLLPETRFVPFGDSRALADAIDERTAAFVVEPVQGNGGVVLPPEGYLAQAAKICHDRGALLIADEIQTGMGRTGAFFASLDEGADCDIICLAKALGGGLPLGAVLARPAVMSALATGSHGSTFGGNPVACRAGLAVIETIEQNGLLARAGAIALFLTPRLRALPHVAAVRARGLLLGIELAAGLMARDVRERALARGLLVTVAGAHVVRLFVPAIAEDEQLQMAVDRLRLAIEDVHTQTSTSS